jgi:uncharacterized protein (TIGR02246 family)
MHSDEAQIRQLVATWMAATRTGEVEKILALMAEDVVFLRPGHPPMRKDEFARAARTQADPSAPTIEGNSEIQEIKVLGDWAYMWAKLSVTMTPNDGAAPTEMAGHTLSVLKKQDGQWVLARDANMLSPVQKPQA